MLDKNILVWVFIWFIMDKGNLEKEMENTLERKEALIGILLNNGK